MKALFLFIFVVGLTASSSNATDRLAMEVSPSVAFAPANLLVSALVAADKENRAIEVIAESPDFYRSSQMELDGKNAPRVTVFRFRSMPSGEYVVTVVLRNDRGNAIAQVESQVNVMSSGFAN